MTRFRTSAAVLLAALAALTLPGCIVIGSTSTTQPESMGPLRLTISACADGAPGCAAAGAANNPSAYGFLQGADSDEELPSQVLLAIRLPEGSVPPSSLLGTLGGGGSITFTRNAEYEADLRVLEPPPAGERWWGWLSNEQIYSRNSTQGFSVTLPTTLPRPADGSALPSPMHWRPVVGIRSNYGPLSETRPVDCGTTNAELYEGNNESGSLDPETICIDSPSSDAARGFLEAPLTDFGLSGSTVQAPPGATVTASFLARRTGPVDPGTTFALAATTTLPGGTVSLDRQSVTLGGDATQPVQATVTVPANNPGGSYRVTLTATAAGKPTRTAVTTVEVPDRVAPVLSSTSLSRTRFRVAKGATPVSARARAGTTLKLSSSEAGTLSIAVQRGTKGRRARGKCSPKARSGRRCTRWRTRATLTRSLATGASSFRLTGRVGSRALRPGSYRLVLSATDAAANRSAVRNLAFRIVRR